MLLKSEYLSGKVIVKLVIACLFAFSLSLASISMGQAQETLFSEEEIGIEQYGFSGTLASGETWYTGTSLYLGEGANIQYDVSWNPQPGVISVGIYNHNTGNYTWTRSSTDSPLSGGITINNEGLYSFAVIINHHHL
ncbi:hypothetical protein [Geomicrobium sp. JCM 19039]|uniref:hypothetical protein n=1 Tax=Geomicrobium sp. JCM 19039 TaxID=1460636 RepID=UPI0005AADD3E|nr:hypothetical protein [Geomicrobium sp. JCM 19039]